jgi:hypothetical protein
MKNYLILLLALVVFNACQNVPESVKIKGELKQWHKITLLIDGPETSEHAAENPFLDYRLDVTFTNGDKQLSVPGFYVADGNAAETSASEGNKWAVRFRPDQAGEWNYSVSFKKAKNIAINKNTAGPEAIAGDGTSGSFTVVATDKQSPDLRAGGRVYYDGGHYFRQADGTIFFKGGADSPENFLAYEDFDQTYRYGSKAIIREGEANPKDKVHQYEPHLKDWKEGDPVWQGGKGKGIIGALNYLASKGVNSQYMLTMNIQGDGKDVWPWTDHNERYRFDCSKLDQWEIVFGHMDQLGMMVHFVLQETENEVLLDGGFTAAQRKLYLRELVARFGHHLAVTWNLGEENGPAGFSPVGQTEQMKKDMANYLKATNPYPNIVVLHTHSNDAKQDEYLLPLLGFESLDGPSMQIGNPTKIHERMKKFVGASAASGRKWIVCLDELGEHWKGIMPDSFDAGHDTVRHHALWGAMMAGGAGVEWYFGYRYPHNDLECEDLRSRDKWWDQTRICLDFFRNYLPVEKMKPTDELISDKNAFCFSEEGNVYAVYLPMGTKQATLDLGKTDKEYTVQWYNPRTGGELQDGQVQSVKGGGKVSPGLPPADPEMDWVVLIR